MTTLSQTLACFSQRSGLTLMLTRGAAASVEKNQASSTFCGSSR